MACSSNNLVILSTNCTASLVCSTTYSKETAVISAISFPFSTDFIELSINSAVSLTACELSSASFLTSSATTANPLPASPALAASIAALRAKRFVCSAIVSIVFIISLMFLEESSISFIALTISVIFLSLSSI